MFEIFIIHTDSEKDVTCQYAINLKEMLILFNQRLSKALLEYVTNQIIQCIIRAKQAKTIKIQTILSFSQ